MESDFLEMGVTAGGRPVALRRVGPEDEEFLLSVYASTREKELSQVAWEPGQREAFLRMQFDSQRGEYYARFPEPEYFVVLVGGEAAGRLWVGRAPKETRILDIALLPEFQNLGVGTILLNRLIEEARSTGTPLRHMIFVLNDAAHRFYQRLGFEVIEVYNGAYLHLEWRPGGLASS